jgi:hypothetical protein
MRAEIVLVVVVLVLDSFTSGGTKRGWSSASGSFPGCGHVSQTLVIDHENHDESENDERPGDHRLIAGRASS